MRNVFTHDEQGAHVGDKRAGHVTVTSDGMSIFDGESQIASFESSIISLGGSALNIVAGYQDNRGSRATALMTDNILFKPTGFVASESQFVGAKVTSSDRIHFTDIGLSDTSVSVSTDNNAATGDIKYTDLIKLMKFTPWTTLMDNGTCRVRYCLRGGMAYLDCYLAAGTSTYTTTKELPKEILPAINGYYPMGTQTGNNTAKIWVGSADGNDGHVYLYNYSSGYATGIIPILPKSME